MSGPPTPANVSQDEAAFEAAKPGGPTQVTYRVVIVLGGRYALGTRCHSLEEARELLAVRRANLPDASLRILRSVTTTAEDWVE